MEAKQAARSGIAQSGIAPSVANLSGASPASAAPAPPVTPPPVANQDDYELASPPPAPANPFASPLSDESDAAADTAVEATRRRLLAYEASIKSIGTLFLLGSVLGVVLGGFYLMIGVLAAVTGEPGAAAAGLLIGIGLVVLGLALFQGWVAMGLNKLAPSVRIPAIVLAAIGLLGFPVGTLISAYALYLLCSTKGIEILSPGYQEVVAATPHIKYKTSIIVWIFVGLLALVVLMVVLMVVFTAIAATVAG